MNEIITGEAAQDLFTVASTSGHRTYLAIDGHFYTGVSSYDVAYTCDEDDCITATVRNLIGEHITESVVDGGIVAYVSEDSNGGFVDATVYERDEDYVSETNEEFLVCDHCGRIVSGEAPSEYIDVAVAQYVETALWSTSVTRTDDEDETPEPLDNDFEPDDIDADTLAEMRADVVAFVSDNWADVSSLEAAQVGHDFWLTREGHGTGFWDRGDGERGDRLTAACKPYGGYDLYVGDDGVIYG